MNRLTRALVGKAYHIFIDKFFPSVSLCNQLLLDTIYCTCRYLEAKQAQLPSSPQGCSKAWACPQGRFKNVLKIDNYNNIY